MIRLTYMARSEAFYETLVEEEEIDGLIRGHQEAEDDLVEALASEPASPRRSSRLQAENPLHRSPSHSTIHRCEAKYGGT